MGQSITVGKKLNGLLKKNHESEKSFEQAVEFAMSPALKNFFSEKASERHEFVQNIKNEIVALGEEIEKNGTPAGTWHGAWMDLNALYKAKNDEIRLEEILSGEKMALEEYTQILKGSTLPPSTLLLLERQRQKILKNLATIAEVEKLMEGDASGRVAR